MQNIIKHIRKLQDKVYNDYGILIVDKDTNGKTQAVFKNIDSFIKVVGTLPVTSEPSPIGRELILTAVADELDYIFYATNSEYEQYKNSRAENTAK